MTCISCPRCGDKTYETFRTYSYCHQCNYNSEYEFYTEEAAVMKLVSEALRQKRQRNKYRTSTTTKKYKTPEETLELIAS